MTTAVSWREIAACRGVDLDKFFGSHPSEARRVCVSCPVAEDCLIDALVHDAASVDARGITYGFRGNTTPGERARLLQRYQDDDDAGDGGA